MPIADRMPRVARMAVRGVAVAVGLVLGTSRGAAAQARPNPCALLSVTEVAAVTGQQMADPVLSSDMQTCRIAAYKAVPYSVIDTGATVTVHVEEARRFLDDYFDTPTPTRKIVPAFGDGALAITTDTLPIFQVRRRNWVYTIGYSGGGSGTLGVPAVIDAEERLAKRVLTRAP